MTIARFVPLLVAAVLFVACGPDDGDDETGGKKSHPSGGSTSGGSTSGGSTSGGSTSGGSTGGAIGAACGTCDEGLVCDMTVPGGYCTKACQQASDCGPDAFCYELQAGGAACLDACASNAECRAGYSCQGDPGSTVCYPSGGGTCNDSVVGVWADGGATYSQLYLYGDGTVYYEYYNLEIGNTESAGSYSFTCPDLTVEITDGYWAPLTMHFTLQNGQLIESGGDAWDYCGMTC